MLFNGGTKLGEVGTLAVAAGNQHMFSRQANQCRNGGTHIGCLGIINKVHAIDFSDKLGTMRQPAEFPQRPQSSSWGLASA